MAFSDWQTYPDPRRLEYLSAPIGPGCYELRLKSSGQLVLFGRSKNVSFRLASLLPPRFGQGTRRNTAKSQFVFERLGDVEYRTLACTTQQDAIRIETGLAANRGAYIFKT